ncbi:MAG: hypothetical protein OER90_06400 [Gemmatimonadota bacterium]|nr:hypothetical protein [Gemmatimonadota bacterium]
MPSDERVELALRVLAGQREAFQSALGTTVEQVQTFLSDHQGSANGKLNRVVAELGPFAAGRIDAERMAHLFGDSLSLDTLTVETIQQARATMTELAQRNHDLFLIDVAPGGDLRTAIGKALEEIGRAFGAVRIFELTRSGSYHGNEHARSLGSFPFVKWSKGERRLAPPLVAVVDGADLRPGLSEYMDGSQKIVLIVRGACTPVPLVRLITPGTFVLQTHDGAGLDRFAAFDGPGIAALVPGTAARFMHDPSGGPDLWDRLTISNLPEKEPRGTIGGMSGAQQAEELRQLKALAARPTAGAAAAAGAAVAPSPAPSDPVGKLATWLLNQADLSDIG